jgi:hypothetical protein
MGNLNRASLAAALAWGLASLAFAGPTWYQSLGLTKDQQIRLRKCNHAKSAAIQQAYADKEGNSEYLATQVLSNSGDGALQPILGQVLSSLQAMEKADDDYWRNLQSFLAPGQVARIYLKFHPDVPPITPPARPKDKVNWVAYIGLTPSQFKQLKDANTRWIGLMKETVARKSAAYQKLEKSVQSGETDAQIGPLLDALLSSMEEKHRIDQEYYAKDLPAFLGPTQVAKLYLHRRPPKTGFNPPSNTPAVKYPVVRKSGPGM